MDSHNQISRRSLLHRTFQVGCAAAACVITRSSRAADEPATERVWRIGCYTRPWDEYDYRIALDAIAQAGFKYVGLMTTKSPTRLVISVSTTPDEAQQIAEELKKRDLKVLSVYGGDIPVAESLEAGIAGLKKLIDNCAACGAKNLLMGGTGDEKLYQAYYKAIAECCGYAADKGIGISIKPHGGLNATGLQCRKAVEKVNHPNFRVWYDPGNILYYSDGKLDPVEDSAALDGLVAGMCIKDYKHPKDVMVTPGAGQVKFSAVLARLKKGGFANGPLLIECLRKGDLTQTLVEATKARAFVEDLVKTRVTQPAN